MNDPAPDLQPHLRIVCVTYSPGETLQAMLDSLARATTLPHEVVLADNGSVDGAPEHAAATRAEVRITRTGGNLGYGGAANIGAADATCEWIAVVNPDVVFEPSALDELVAAAERWPRAGALGPAVRTPDGRLYPSARALPSIGRGIGHATFGWWWPQNPWTAAYRRERSHPTEGPCGWLSGSCLLLRRETFDAVGGFDPGYFMYLEDLDLCERLGRSGYQSVYVPSAVILHEGGHATRKQSSRMLREHHRSAYRYVARRYCGPRWAPLRWVVGAGLAARWTLSLVSRRISEGAPPTRSADVLKDSRPS